MKLKVLTTLSIGLAYVAGVLTGMAIPILLVKRTISKVRKTFALSKTGTRVMATVTRIKTHAIRRSITINLPDNINGIATSSRPSAIHFLFARWQHPDTRKIYTFKGTVMNPDAYPVGSSIPFLVDYTYPKTHIIANTIPESMSTDSSM